MKHMSHSRSCVYHCKLSLFCLKITIREVIFQDKCDAFKENCWFALPENTSTAETAIITSVLNS